MRRWEADLKAVLRATVGEFNDPRYDEPMRALSAQILHDPELAADYAQRASFLPGEVHRVLRGTGTRGVSGIGLLAGAYVLGAIPFSNVAARLLRGVDLRSVGGGTVSGTALHRVGGFGPLIVAGTLDVAKGAVGPVLAGANRPLAAAAGAMAVAGHNWSPFLRGAGGRGISPALGALLVNQWQGAVLLLLGVTAGRVAGRTSLGAFVAYVGLVPALARIGGRDAAVAGAAVLIPIFAKRVLGNRPPAGPDRGRILLNRLIHDQDEAPRR